MSKDPCDTPQVIKLAEGFYVRQAVDNIAWLDLGDGLVVVDALEQPELEGEVFAAIGSTVGQCPVRHVLNTHTHYDHVALNAAFERRGAGIVNQQTAPLPAGGRWFKGPLRQVQMLPLPGCHTQDDCIVWVPRDKVLFVGDIFGWGLIPLEGGLDDAAARHLLNSYGRLIEFGAAVVVPGHGPMAATAELRRWVEYFRWLLEQVGPAVAAGKNDAQIADQVRPPEDMKTWWRFLKWKHQDSLAKVIRAIRGGRLTSP